MGGNFWFRRGIGRWTRAEERRLCREVGRDFFGVFGAQLGGDDKRLLPASRLRNALFVGRRGGNVIADWRELPLESDFLDLLILPHTLEAANDPRAVLRESARVLRPEGRLIVIGFNPRSLLGLSTKAPWRHRWLSVARLKDWLSLLDLHPIGGAFAVFQPPWKSLRLRHWRWMEHAGRRWWPLAGGVFVLQAVKRRRGMRLVLPAKFRREASLRRIPSAAALKAPQATAAER